MGDTDALTIRRELIENDKVEAIIVLPRELFITTDISVTLWILNQNKKGECGTDANNVIEKGKFSLWIYVSGQKTQLRVSRKEGYTQGQSNQAGNGDLF